jgi:hypothetical protein
MRLLKRWLLAAVVGAALLAAASPATAQVYPPVRPVTGPYGLGNGVGVGSSYGPYSPGYAPAYPTAAPSGAGVYAQNPYVGASQASLTTSPSGTGPTVVSVGDPYVNPYTTNPYVPNYSPAGGYLSGKADLTTARANAGVTQQRAYLVQEEVIRSRWDTRRRVWDEVRYERMSLMNSEQARQLLEKDRLDRARHEPPLNEIWSGASINDLFKYLVAQQGKGVVGPDVPLNEDTLKHINLTGPKGGNIGLLKSEIRWPAPLLRPEFETSRKLLSELIPKAMALAANGEPVPTGMGEDIAKSVEKMQDVLLRSIGEMKPEEYMTAKKYLNMLEEAAKVLNGPNATDFVSGKFNPSGKNVKELIKFMTEKGLQFAPAAPGDEPSYWALYHALAAYDAGMTQTVSKPRD